MSCSEILPCNKIHKHTTMPFARFLKSLIRNKNCSNTPESLSQSSQSETSTSITSTEYSDTCSYGKNSLNYGRTLILQDDNFLILHPDYLEHEDTEINSASSNRNINYKFQNDQLTVVSDRGQMGTSRNSEQIKVRRVCAIYNTDSGLRVALKKKCRRRLLGDYECNCQYCETLSVVKKTYTPATHHVKRISKSVENCSKLPNKRPHIPPKKESNLLKRLEDKINYISEKVRSLENVESSRIKVRETETQYSKQMVKTNTKKTTGNTFMFSPSCCHKTWQYKTKKPKTKYSSKLEANDKKHIIITKPETDKTDLIENKEFKKKESYTYKTIKQNCVVNKCIESKTPKKISIPRKKVSEQKLTTRIEETVVPEKGDCRKHINRLESLEVSPVTHIDINTSKQQDSQSSDGSTKSLDNKSWFEGSATDCNDTKNHVTKIFICKNRKQVDIIQKVNEKCICQNQEEDKILCLYSNSKDSSYTEFLSLYSHKSGPDNEETKKEEEAKNTDTSNYKDIHEKCILALSNNLKNIDSTNAISLIPDQVPDKSPMIRQELTVLQNGENYVKSPENNSKTNISKTNITENEKEVINTKTLNDFFFNIPIDLHLNLSYENSVGSNNLTDYKISFESDGQDEIKQTIHEISEIQTYTPPRVLESAIPPIKDDTKEDKTDLFETKNTNIKTIDENKCLALHNNEKTNKIDIPTDRNNANTQLDCIYKKSSTISLTEGRRNLDVLKHSSKNRTCSKTTKYSMFKGTKVTPKSKDNCNIKKFRETPKQNKNFTRNINNDATYAEEYQYIRNIFKNLTNPEESFPENYIKGTAVKENRPDFDVHTRTRPMPREKKIKSKIPVRVMKKPSLKQLKRQDCEESKLISNTKQSRRTKKEHIRQQNSEEEIELDTNLEEFVNLFEKLDMNIDKSNGKNIQILDSLKRLEECNRTLEWLSRKLES